MLYKLWAIKLHNFVGTKNDHNILNQNIISFMIKQIDWEILQAIIKLLGDCTIVYNSHCKTKTHIWII